MIVKKPLGFSIDLRLSANTKHSYLVLKLHNTPLVSNDKSIQNSLF